LTISPIKGGNGQIVTMTRRYGRAGLGLAISNRLAKALGGNIKVTSQVGTGSTFTLAILVKLPKDIVYPNSAECLSAKGPDNAVQASQTPVQGRILLVEDIVNVRKVICAVLDKIGLKTDAADNGSAACEMAMNSLAEKSPYDLIFMDIQMPTMDGYEATHKLRQLGWRLPIVALTAHAMSGDRDRCIAAGCDDYLAKPINCTQLQKIIAQFLGEAKVSTDLSADAREKQQGILKSGVLDPAVAADLMRQYRDELPGRAELIGKAFDDRDRKRLAHLTHQLKGAAGIYGLDRISEIARLINQLAQGDVALDELQATVCELFDMCRQASVEPPRDSSDRNSQSRLKKSTISQKQPSRRTKKRRQ
jgi:CheY-like chemotaxis protein/HPt (histidine-containing phosphotransfer) domain-containing protein